MNLRLTLMLCVLAAFAVFTMNIVITSETTQNKFGHWSLKTFQNQKSIEQSVDSQMAAPKRD